MHQDDPGVFWAADAAEARQQILLTLAELAVDDDDGFGAMIPGVNRFGNQGRVLRESLVAAPGGEARRLVAEHDDDLTLHVDSGVIVVTELTGRRSVTGKHDWRVSFS